MLAYHLIANAVVIYLFESKNYRGGPCNPGLDLLSFILYALTVLILLVVSLYLIYKNKANKYFLLINVGVTVVWSIVMLINS